MPFFWISPRFEEFFNASFNSSISDDGTKVLYVSNRQGNSDLYLWESQTKTSTAVASTLKDESLAQISGDGSTAVFIRDPKTAPTLYMSDLNEHVTHKVFEFTGDNADITWKDAPRVSYNGEAVVYTTYLPNPDIQPRTLMGKIQEYRWPKTKRNSIPDK